MLNFENYIIRPLETTDIEQFFDLVERNRKRLEDFFTGTVSKTQNIEATRMFLTEITTKREAKQYYPYILMDNLTKNFIGFLDIKNIDWTIPKAELGCYTDEKYAGMGLTTKAGKLFVDYCFDYFSFKKLLVRTHHSNIAAQRLATSCGFEVEGTIRMDYKTTNGEIVDLIYFGRINNLLSIKKEFDQPA